METMTAEEIAQMIRAAADSVTVIDEMIAKVAAGAALSLEIKGNLQRNVEHLKGVTANEAIIASGSDISALVEGAARGEARLAEGEWPADPEPFRHRRPQQ